jgi:hypothetical protein
VKRKGQRNVVSPVSLDEVYREVGDYTAKMLIDPESSQKIDTVGVAMTNADGRPMSFEYRRWGTKLLISFKIDSSTPDGLALIDISLKGPKFDQVRERLSAWIVK